MMHTKYSQRGAVLITSLIMLVVLTLLVISGIRSSTTNLRIAGNMQLQEEAVAAAQQAIEGAISSVAFTGGSIPAQTIGNYAVTFSAPVCQSSKAVQKTDIVPDECIGSAGKTYCYWSTWEITATVTNAQSGAQTEVHQGVKLPVGQARAFAFCGAV